MSATKKVFLIVILGVGACLLSFLISQYFFAKQHRNRLVLSSITQIETRIEHLQSLGKTFIRNTDKKNWYQLFKAMESVRVNLTVISPEVGQWKNEIKAVQKHIDDYYIILGKLYKPAIDLNTEKTALQNIGLAFSEEIEEKIIKPYRKAELQTHSEDSIDPYKSRIKDTAYYLDALHIKQQLLLHELFITSNLSVYRQKKRRLSDAISKQSAQLRQIGILMGNDSAIQATIDSLDKKLNGLVNHEHTIIDLFINLSTLEKILTRNSRQLLTATHNLSAKIVSDTLYSDRLNQVLNWSLLVGILACLGTLGTLLALDIVHFVKDLKETQQDLKKSEEKYRDLFNDAPIMDIITAYNDGVPTIINANKTFLDLIGFKRDEVIGRPLSDFYSPESKKKLIEDGGYQKALREGIRSAERELITRGGDIIETLLYARPERSTNAKSIGTRALYLNISDLKKAEAETQQLEKALLHAQKMEAIGTLAGGIAHDFNNILSIVIGYSELILQDTIIDHPTHTHVKHILEAGIRGRDLADQILMFGRPDERALTPLQMGPIVKETLKMVRSVLPSTIEISRDIDACLDYVNADPTQVYQIIMNLCTNAAHAMEDNGGQLFVSLSQVEIGSKELQIHPRVQPGSFIKLSVQDTGQGIPADIMEHIYDPFFTTKEMGKGTGLGLPVVHGIVKNYGGAIEASSELGKGTIFDVYIPAIPPISSDEQIQATTLPTGHERILLVDDEPVLIKVSKQMLEMLGYTITACRGSLEALETFRKAPHEIDLVLTDMTMPKMTGDKLILEMMKIRSDLPAILNTGYSHKMSDQKAHAIGIKAYVHKPIIVTELANTIRKVLDGT